MPYVTEKPDATAKPDVTVILAAGAAPVSTGRARR